MLSFPNLKSSKNIETDKMRFSKVWILPLVGSSVGFTSTKYYALGNPNNKDKDITARNLRVETGNTEERTGGPEVFVKAIGALPQDVVAFTKVTAHAATDVEKTISEKQAELIKQTLWNEFQQQKWLPEFDRLDRADLMPIFVAFVQEDQRRTSMFEEWSKWRGHKELAQGTAVLKSALVDTTAKTKQLIPDETAELVWPAFWNEFIEQMHLPQLPSFDRFDPILQAYLKPKLLAFIVEDEDRTWLFNEWIHWKHKASNNGALTPDSFSAFLPSMVHEPIAAAKVISDTTAESILKILWNEFQQKHVPESKRKPSFEYLDLFSQMAIKPRFLYFVYEDGSRTRIFEEWLKWQNHIGRKEALAQDIPAFKRAKQAMTQMPPMPVVKISDEEAEFIQQKLWNEFQQQHVRKSDRKSTFNQLDLLAQNSLKPQFLKFVYEDNDRARMFEKWLDKNEAWVQDVTAFKLAMDQPRKVAGSIKEKKAQLIWHMLWKEFKHNEHLPSSFRMPAFGHLIGSQTALKSNFLAFVYEGQRRRIMFKKLLLMWQKSRQPGRNVLH